ncbi:MAG: M14 family metallopeptidase [Phycisphaerae bacterium]|nr:M14 family metallopeptidase [Phycisphaerae bacterium]
MKYLEALQGKGAPISTQFIGVSIYGHKIPLVITSRPPITSPTDARRAGKLVVYVQANIHAGEVEGKEAVLMLLRDLAQGPKGGLLDKMVLLITPIYNIDGNEAWDSWQKNRRSQNEPEVVGKRTNGQGLDLNRDGMKTESPEMQAALKFIYTTWDPDVFVDLHATNGTRHGYRLTYSPPLHPDTQDDLLRFNRDELFSVVQRRMRNEFDTETFVYGNIPRNSKSQGWYQSAPDPRRITNYVGLRNRLAVLSEATCYFPFRQRVETTHRFVLTVLEEIGRRQQDIINLTREADARVIGWGLNPETAPALTIGYKIASRGTEKILLEKPPSTTDSSKTNRITPPQDFVSVQMPVYDRFVATKTARFPAAYFIPSTFTKTVEQIRRHGIAVERTLANWNGPVEMFVIDKVVTAERPYQGHKLKELEGNFKSTQTEISKGGYLVRTAQPLGILIFHLLEPESIDGVAAWGFLDPDLPAKGHYPIYKCFDQVRVATERLPNY